MSCQLLFIVSATTQIYLLLFLAFTLSRAISQTIFSYGLRWGSFSYSNNIVDGAESRKKKNGIENVPNRI